MMRSFLRSRDGLAIVLLTGVAAALRFATIGQQSYWYDEAITASMLDGSLADVFRGVVELTRVGARKRMDALQLDRCADRVALVRDS